VSVSSDLMSGMSLTAELVIGRGRLLADTPTADLIRQASSAVVTVRTPDAARLAGAIAGPQVSVTARDADSRSTGSPPPGSARSSWPPGTCSTS